MRNLTEEELEVYRKLLKEKSISTEFNIFDYYYIPNACKNCSNHPINGGSGICHCTLGTPTIY